MTHRQISCQYGWCVYSQCHTDLSTR